MKSVPMFPAKFFRIRSNALTKTKTDLMKKTRTKHHKSWKLYLMQIMLVTKQGIQF